MKYLHLVWAGLWRSRARAVLTMLSIAVAFVLFGLLQGIDAWFAGLLPGLRADRLIVVSRVSEIPVTAERGYRALQAAGGDRATPLAPGGAPAEGS